MNIGDFITKGVRFAGVGAVGFGINLLLLYILVQGFHVWYISAEILATNASLIWNYLGNIAVGNIRLESSKTALVQTERKELVKRLFNLDQLIFYDVSPEATNYLYEIIQQLEEVE